LDNSNYNDPFQKPSPDPYSYHESGSPGMAKAAFILGICSLLFSLYGLGLTFAVLGIIFALLSRGRGSMQKPAKIGVGLSAAGLIVGCIVMVFSLVSVVNDVSKMNWTDIIENYEDILPNGSDIPSNDTTTAL